MAGGQGADAFFESGGDEYRGHLGGSAGDEARVEGGEAVWAVRTGHGVRVGEGRGERCDQVRWGVFAEAGLPHGAVADGGGGDPVIGAGADDVFDPGGAVGRADALRPYTGHQLASASGSYGSDAVSAGVGSVRASVKAAITSTGVWPPKLAYQAGRSGCGAWVRVHHCPSGTGSGRRRVFWSVLESRTRGINGSLP